MLAAYALADAGQAISTSGLAGVSDREKLPSIPKTALTPIEHNRNIDPIPHSQARALAMSEPAPTTDNDRYERACAQAIAMCDGNLRSTIKALIMANEYLEAELQELQATISNSHARGKVSRAKGEAA
jgi:hypothetical protein